MLVIQADGRVPHETIVEIYNMAMRAGISKVAIAARLASEPGPVP